MNVITIRQNAAGLFDVLLNGHSYRIHRNLSADKADMVAAEAAQQFRAMRQRAVIERLVDFVARAWDNQPGDLI